MGKRKSSGKPSPAAREGAIEGGKRAAASAPQSPFETCTVKIGMALPPKALENVEDAVSYKLQGRLMRYDEELGGVMIAFRNASITSPAAHIFNELPTLHIALTVDVLLFSPARGMLLRGMVNKVTSQHVGIIVYGAFNATVPADQLPEAYRHSPAEEAWFDPATGNGIGAGSRVCFAFDRSTVTSGLITMTGSMRAEGTGPLASGEDAAATPRAVHFLPENDGGPGVGVEEEEDVGAPDAGQSRAPAQEGGGKGRKRARRTDADEARPVATPDSGDSGTPAPKRQRSVDGGCAPRKPDVGAEPSSPGSRGEREKRKGGSKKHKKDKKSKKDKKNAKRKA